MNLNPPPPEPSLYAPAAVVPTEEDFTVEDECPSQIEFDGDSKGFEGAIAVRGADGDLYMLVSLLAPLKTATRWGFPFGPEAKRTPLLRGSFFVDIQPALDNLRER